MSWNLRRPSRRLAGAALGLLVAGAAACTKEKLVQGECQQFNGADVCTWGRTVGDSLVAFGATVPMKSIENAPAEIPMAWPPKMAAAVTLPAAVKSATGFDVLTIFWEPHGHPPGPYLAPHFDFHFYDMAIGDIRAIDCADSTKPAQLPAGYELPDATIPQLGTLIGICVPGMGMHSLLGSELHASTLFQKTMVMGYYHKKSIFVEPMITRATLMARRSFPIDIPDVPDRPAGTRYPTRFRADYDSTAQAYKFVFSSFTGGTK
jgi:hypothetical protein